MRPSTAKFRGLNIRPPARVSIAGIAVLAAIGLAACGSSSPPGGGGDAAAATGSLPPIPAGDINVGISIATTGALGPLGAQVNAEFSAVIKLFNAQGGIDGHQIHLISFNDQSDPAVAVAGARQMVADHVTAMFYAGLSETAAQTLPIFDANHIPVLQGDSEDQYRNPQVFPYFFPTSPQDAGSIEANVEELKASGITKVAVLNDSSPIAVDFWIKDFDQSAKKNGITVAGDYTYPLDAVDVSTEVRQAKATGATTLVVLAEAGLNHVYDALREIGWTPTMYIYPVGYAVGYSDLGSLASHAYGSCYVTLPSTTAKFDAQDSKILTDIYAGVADLPGSTSDLTAYDSLEVLSDAITANKSLDGAAIKAYLEKNINNKSFSTSSISYTYSPTVHTGIPGSDVKLCRLDQLGEFKAGVVSPTVSPGS
jgi:branched-chain amino acid transport system substrate-binding protein